MESVKVFSGLLVVDLLLPGCLSLKDRRKPLRSLLQKLHNQDFSATQFGKADLHQRVFLAVSVVSGNAVKLEELLDAAERVILDSSFEMRVIQRDTNTFSEY